MRRIGTAGAFIAAVLLVRCGEVGRPALPPVPALPSAAAIPAPRPVAQAASDPAPKVKHPDQQTQFETVRELVRSLGTPGCGPLLVLDDETGLPLPGQERREVKELRAMGVAAFADYDTILADPTSEWEEINGVCTIICDLRTGRRFIPLLIQRLAVPDALVRGDASRDATRRFVRQSIISTLAELGDEQDAWVLLRVLRRDGRGSWHDAARALAKIGGPRELEAFDQWLSEQNPGDPLVPFVRKHRDALESRLLAHPSRRTF